MPTVEEKARQIIDRHFAPKIAAQRAARQPRVSTPPPIKRETSTLGEDTGPSQPFIASIATWTLLGEHRGKLYGTVAGWDDREFVLEDDGRPVVDLTPGAFFLQFDEREPLGWTLEHGRAVPSLMGDKYRRLQPRSPGTYARLLDPQPVKAKAGQPRAWAAPLPLIRGRTRSASTPDTIYRELGRLGISIGWSAEHRRLLVWSSGRPDVRGLDIIARFRTMLEADKAGTWPLPCAYAGDDPHPATTVDPIGTPVCGDTHVMPEPESTGVLSKAKHALGLSG